MESVDKATPYSIHAARSKKLFPSFVFKHAPVSAFWALSSLVLAYAAETLAESPKSCRKNQNLFGDKVKYKNKCRMHLSP
jgi:hypothetical protein